MPKILFYFLYINKQKSAGSTVLENQNYTMFNNFSFDHKAFSLLDQQDQMNKF